MADIGGYLVNCWLFHVVSVSGLFSFSPSLAHLPSQVMTNSPPYDRQAGTNGILCKPSRFSTAKNGVTTDHNCRGEVVQISQVVMVGWEVVIVHDCAVSIRMV